MQLHLDLAGGDRVDPERLRERLTAAFGPPAPHVRRDPVAQLVRSVIASRTQDAVSDEVLAQLRAAFRPLGRIGEARAEEVLAVIAPVTHAERKAPQLIEAVRRVGRLRGAVTLDFLEGWPLDDAMAWLQELPGAGQKVAASVLNFSTLARRVMVVDGHVARVAERTGLAASRDPGEVRLTIMDRAPDGWEAEDFSDLHKLMKRLGQLHCHAATPECPGCPLRDGCPEGGRRFGDPPPHRPAGGHGARGPRPVHPPPAPANENSAAADGEAAWAAYLRRRIARIEARGRRPPSEPVASAVLGASALDAAVGGGLPPGAHQSAPGEPGDLAAPLILPLTVAAHVAGAGVKLLVVQERAAAREGGELYAPGLEAMGVAPAETAFVRVPDGAEVLRVVDEAVNRRAAPVVLAELRRGASLADLAATRRLNLQAQRRGLWLFLVTPDLHSTSAALTRWRVASAPSRGPPGRIGPPAFRLALLRNRLGPAGEWACEWSARERRFTSAVPVVPRAAGPAVHGDGRCRDGALAAFPVAAPVGADALDRPAAAGAA